MFFIRLNVLNGANPPRKILRKLWTTEAPAPRAPELPPAPAPQIEWGEAVVSLPQPKRMISLRVDPEVLDFFQAQGKGYQTRINAVLRAWVEAQRRKG